VLLVMSLRNRGSAGHYQLLVQSFGDIDGHSVESAKTTSIQATDWRGISSLVISSYFTFLMAFPKTTTCI